MTEISISTRIELKNICRNIVKGNNLDYLILKMRSKILARIDALNPEHSHKLIEFKWQLESLKALRQEIKEIAEEKIN